MRYYPDLNRQIPEALGMISQIRKSFFFVERGWLNANHFVFNGREKILIDTGYVSSFEETKNWIQAVGVDLKSIDLIVSTHSHCDHIGGNKKIQEISGCQIAIHQTDKQSIDSRDDWATWYRFYDQEAEFFPVDLPLQDGETLRLDDLVLEVIHTPGHARGGICLYCPQDRFLISSDALWDGDLGVINTIVEGKEAPSLALNSLQKISSVQIETVYPGHGEIIRNPQSAIRKCRAKLEEFLENPRKLGKDHLKKILIWVLLMKGGYPKDRLFDYLLTTLWFNAVVKQYFEGRYQDTFNDLIDEFLEREIICTKDGSYHTTIRP